MIRQVEDELPGKKTYRRYCTCVHAVLLRNEGLLITVQVQSLSVWPSNEEVQ